jgi:Kef-type K+ transport system membrane component KefB
MLKKTLIGVSGHESTVVTAMMDFPKPISIAEEPILTFAILLLILIFIPLLFRKIKLTGVVGLILAGAVAGPNGLGWIEARGVIDVLGIIGLIYLMFMAGLELNLDRFRKEKNNAVVFGSFTFFVPMIFGTLIFSWLGYSLAAALLIASMFASHTLITYPVIMRLNLTREPSVSAAIGATVITDTAALLVISVVARSVDGELGMIFWVTLTALFVVYMFFMFVILPVVSSAFFRIVEDSDRYTYVYVIAVMLLCAWLAQVIGTEAILGAFLAGLALNRLLTSRGTLKNRIDFFGEAFFIPIFLIFVGMQVDFGIFLSEAIAWVVMITMLFTGIFSKWLAAWLSGKILNFSSGQVWLLFGMSVTEGAATLAAIFIGYELGIFGEAVYNGAILLILVTCLIGPLIVEKYGFTLTDDTTYELEKGSEKKQKILVPIANPQSSARLIELSANICRDTQGVIYPLSVLNRLKSHVQQRERAEKILELASGQVHAVNLQAHPLFITNMNVAEGIIQAAETHSVSEIVIGWDGETSTKLRIFGRIVDQVIGSATQQLFVCKIDRPLATFRKIKIIVPPDLVKENRFTDLFETLMNLAENINAEIEISHISRDRDLLRKCLKILNKSNVSDLNEFETFDLLMDHLLEKTESSDLILLINKQAGSYGWTYGVNAIPRQSSRFKPGSSFIFAYPARDEEEPYSQSSLLFSN